MNKLALKTKVKGVYRRYDPLLLKNGHLALFNSLNTIIFHKNFKEEKTKHENDNISVMKQLKNGLIIGAFKSLFIYSVIKSKMILSKSIDIPNLLEEEYIMDLIELRNGDLIAITEFKLLKIKLGDNNDEITQIYEFLESVLFCNNIRFFEEKKLNIHDLGNNNILIHSQIIAYLSNYKNKTIIFNLDNFKIIEYKIFQKKASIVVLEKYFCICDSKYISIYDINDYEKLLNTIYINHSFVNKFNETSIILLRNLQSYHVYCNKDIILINLSDIKDIKYQNFHMDFINLKSSSIFCPTKLLKLDSNELIIFSEYIIYVCVFMKPFDFKPIEGLLN